MNREYDILEKFPNSTVIWWALVVGLGPAHAKLRQLAGRSKNEFFAIHTPMIGHRPVAPQTTALKDPHPNSK